MSDERRVLTSPGAARVGMWFAVVGAATLLVNVALVMWPGQGAPRLAFAPLLLMSGFYVAYAWRQRRTRVELHALGVDVYAGVLLLRPRRVRWSDVDRLWTDPPGGPRLIRLRLSDGTEVALPPLSDQDSTAVRDAYAAAAGA